MAMKLSFDGKVVNGQVASIVKQAKSFRDNIKYVMANIVMHAVEHNQVTPANKLCDQLHEIGGQRVNDMREWFEENGPFVWDNDSKSFKLDSAKAKKAKQVLDKIGVNKFAKPLIENSYDLKKEKPYQGFNLKSKMIALLKQAKRIAGDETKADHELTDLTGIDNLQELIMQMDAPNDNDAPQLEVITEEVAA